MKTIHSEVCGVSRVTRTLFMERHISLVNSGELAVQLYHM